MVSAILLALLQTAPAARQPSVPPAVRTAAVRGKVVADDTGYPVRYASVQLTTSGAGHETFTVTTDSSGVFEIRGIEPGSYSARAAKPGFITLSYKDATDDSGQLKLAAGQVEAEINFRLLRAAVISGTITDSYGEPVSNANIQAMSKTYSGGHVQLRYRTNTQTDDRGEYRLHDLAAGRYYVQASKANQGQAGVALATTLFPNATRLEDAQPVVVKAGEERQGVNVTLQEALLVNVSGRVVDAESGQAMTNVFLNISPATNGGVNVSSGVSPDGGFRFHNVPAATYRLFVNVAASRIAPEPEVPWAILAATWILLPEVLTTCSSGSAPEAPSRGRCETEGGALPDQFQIFLASRGPDRTSRAAPMQPLLPMAALRCNTFRQDPMSWK